MINRNTGGREKCVSVQYMSFLFTYPLHKQFTIYDVNDDGMYRRKHYKSSLLFKIQWKKQS